MAELGQAQLKLGLDFTRFFVDLVYLYLVWNLACGWIGSWLDSIYRVDQL